VLKDRLQRLPAVVMRALMEAKERRERREAQAALEEQRVLLSTLIDSLPEIIYAVDTNNRVKVVNKALLDTLGRRRDQAPGPPTAPVTRRHGMRSYINRALQSALAAGRSFASGHARRPGTPTSRHRTRGRWWQRSRFGSSARSASSGTGNGYVASSRARRWRSWATWPCAASR